MRRVDTTFTIEDEERRMRIVTLRKSIVFAVLALAMVGTLLPQTASAGVRSIANVASFDATEAAGPSMVLDENDNPVIAYVNTSTNRLMILRCDDPACVSGGDITTTEAALTGRGWPSIALTNEGFPVVAYADGQDINVLRCNDPVCKGSDSLVGVASGALGFPTVEVTSDNHPVVLFVAEDLSMKVVACLNFNCNQRMGAISPVTGQQLGSPPRMRLDQNDRPVIANTLSGTGHLQLVRCNTTTCEGGASTVVNTDPHLTADVEIVPNPDGSEDIYVGSVQMPPSGFDLESETFGDTNMYHCNSSNCTDLWHNVATPTFYGYRQPAYPDFVVTPTGPVVAIADYLYTRRTLVASFNPEDDPNQNRRSMVTAPDMASVGEQIPSLQLDSQGNAVLATLSDAGIRVVRCDDAGCVPTCNGQRVTVDLNASRAEVGEEIQVPFSAVVRGTMGNDTIREGTVICGLGGDDDIRPSQYSSVFGGAGNDRIQADGGNNFISGGPGNDVLIGGARRDRLFGGPGADRIDGGPGSDRVSGGDGNDILFGGDGDDRIFGNLGRDTIEGGAGNDIIKGGAWIDTVDGGAGDDDRCGIVEGEVRLNCERGVFGL